MAAVVVSTAADVLSPTADTSSIAGLIANDGGDGISLREAIAAADNTAGEDAITFDENVFTGGDNSVIRLVQGQLEISDSLDIDGTSVGGVLITGDANGDDATLSGTQITDVSANAIGDLTDNSRVLNFSSSTGDLSLAGLTITGGQVRGTDGAGILFQSSGTLGLINSDVSGNYISSGFLGW